MPFFSVIDMMKRSRKILGFEFWEVTIPRGIYFIIILLLILFLSFLTEIGRTSTTYTSDSGVYESNFERSLTPFQDPIDSLDIPSHGVQSSDFNDLIQSVRGSIVSPQGYNDFVDNNLSDIDGVEDIGSHSNFTSQQYYDSAFDNLTEDISNGVVSEDLYVDSWDSSRDEWAEYGDSPYLDTQDQPLSYVYGVPGGTGSDDGDQIGDFGFENPSSNGSLSGVTLHVYGRAYEVKPDEAYFTVWLWDGSSWTQKLSFQDESVWKWKSVDVTSVLNTWQKI